LSISQKLLLLATALFAVGLILYPPWMEYYFAENGQPSTTYHGYHLLWDRPANTPGVQAKGKGVRVYTTRLSGHLMILSIATFVGYAWLGSRAKSRAQQDINSGSR